MWAHGNADTERLFSHVDLNKTKHRKSLALTTLNSILLTVQFNKPIPCYSFKPSNELTRLCKNSVDMIIQIETTLYIITDIYIIFVCVCVCV